MREPCHSELVNRIIAALVQGGFYPVLPGDGSANNLHLQDDDAPPTSSPPANAS